MPVREILDMVNEDVAGAALGNRSRRQRRLDEEELNRTTKANQLFAGGPAQAAPSRSGSPSQVVTEAAGGVAKKGLNKLAEAGVTAAATAVGGPAGAAAAQGAMKGAKALKAANKIAGTVRDVSKALTPSETTKQKLGGAARTAALVKSLVGTRKIKPEKDERLQAMKEQYKQVAATDTGLTPAEKRQIRGETAAQTAKGFEQFGDPNRVGATTADLDRTVATERESGLRAAGEIKDETDIRFVDKRKRLDQLRGESEGRLDRLEERELQRKRAADYDRGKALEGYAEYQEKRGKTDEVQQDLDDEAERRLRRERDRELEKGTPRWSQKKTGGMTRKEILGSLGLGDDIPEYVLDMSTEELYKLAREKGLI